MSFGTALQSAYEQASEEARIAFDSMAESVNDFINSASDAAQELAKRSQSAHCPAKQKALESFKLTKNKAQQGARALKSRATLVAKKVVEQVKKAKQKVAYFFGPKPAGEKIQFCSNRSKKERLAYRQEKIAQAQEHAKDMHPGPGREVLEKATERFEFNNRAVERARLAESAYFVKDEDGDVALSAPPEGWSRPSVSELKKLGVDPANFPTLNPEFNPEEHQDGFHVDIFKTDPDVFGEEKYVVSFRGTKGGKDWTTNAKQSLGMETEHYSKAMIIARDTSNILGPQMEVTGHSLGGGLATAAGIVSGGKTYAFNPAGVHPDTLKQMGDLTRDMAMQTTDGKPLVDNVVVLGDPVTGLQNKTMQRTLVGASVGTAVGALSTLAGPLGVSAVASGALSNRATREQGTLGAVDLCCIFISQHTLAATS